MIDLSALLLTAFYALFGILLMIVSNTIMDFFVPGDFAAEIKRGNCAVAWLSAGSFIGMMVWLLAPMILVVAFAKVAKNGFGIRWGIYMAVWALCWSISMFFPTAAVRVPLAAVIAVASFVGALVEARR